MTKRKQTQRKPNVRLAQAREERGWSQEDLARMLGEMDKRTIIRWEIGETAPSAHHRDKLRVLFQMSDIELGFGSQEGNIPPYFGIPYPRNKYFTGREDTLNSIHEALNKSSRDGFPVAISGLGGLGKTQLVLEYAYYYSHLYQAVFWIRATSYSLMVSDFVSIASILNLPEKDEPYQTKVVHAVRQWLTRNKNWLLIFDDVENLDVLSEFLPFEALGHTLLTTRSQLVGIHATKLNIEKMELEEGATLLLRRAGKIGPEEQIDNALAHDRESAMKICREMDGLPLALDQAGAYIESNKHQDGVTKYFALYQKRRAELLAIRGTPSNEHILPVTTTFSLALDKVREANPSAVALLQLCVFLHPDAIPEELITHAPDFQSSLSDPIRLHHAIEELLKYSLVRRIADAQALEIHRLVQAVLKDTMDDSKQHIWAERVVRAVDAAYTATNIAMVDESEHYSLIKRTERYDIHAQECVKLLEKWKDLATLEMHFVLMNAGSSLRQRMLYTLAEPLLQKSVSLSEQLLGAESSPTANCIANLAVLYEKMGRNSEAEALYKRALAIDEQNNDNPIIAVALANLGQFYSHIREYDQAEKLFERALNLYKKQSKVAYDSLQSLFHNFILLYMAQGKYKLAEQMEQELQLLKEKVPNIKQELTVVELGRSVFSNINRQNYAHAEQQCQQAFSMLDQAQVPKNHQLRMVFLGYLADIYTSQERDTEAEECYLHILQQMREETLGAEHPEVAKTLINLAGLYAIQGKYDQAVTHYEQALSILQQSPEYEKATIIEFLVNLAELYKRQKKYEKARLLYEQALIMSNKKYGIMHQSTAYTIIAYTSLLEETEQWEEAKEYKDFLSSLNPEWVEAVRTIQKQVFERKKPQSQNPTFKSDSERQN